MAAYCVFEVDISDPSWRAKYGEPTAALVKKHGGRYLAASPAAKKLEGSRAVSTAVVIIEFPDAEAAKAWHSDPEYQPLIELRNSGSTAEAMMVPGL